MKRIRKATKKIKNEKIRRGANKTLRAVAKDPIGLTAAQAIPVPGATVAYLGAKKGLEKGLDFLAPPVSKQKAMAAGRLAPT